jgi:hypothetical protein
MGCAVKNHVNPGPRAPQTPPQHQTNPKSANTTLWRSRPPRFGALAHHALSQTSKFNNFLENLGYVGRIYMVSSPLFEKTKNDGPNLSEKWRRQNFPPCPSEF